MFKKFSEEQPNGDGYYYVRWECDDTPVLVYLWDCREICLGDREPLWDWGWNKNDDPEAVLCLDIKNPCNIEWCNVDEFERVSS